MKYKNIMIGICISIILILGGTCLKMYFNKRDMQGKIDDSFHYNYNALILNMWNMTEIAYDESHLAKLNVENTRHGALLTTLLPYTSYSRNYYLDEVVGYLDQASGNDAFIEMPVNRELYQKLMELNGNFRSVELAENVNNILAEIVNYVGSN